MAGLGNGYIDAFDPTGKLLQRLVNRGPLNAPWGIVDSIAKNAIFVSNYGDGIVNVFNRTTGEFLGSLKDKHGNTITNDGLLGLAGDEKQIFFAAGINGGKDGLFGKMIK